MTCCRGRRARRVASAGTALGVGSGWGRAGVGKGMARPRIAGQVGAGPVDSGPVGVGPRSEGPRGAGHRAPPRTAAGLAWGLQAAGPANGQRTWSVAAELPAVRVAAPPLPPSGSSSGGAPRVLHRLEHSLSTGRGCHPAGRGAALGQAGHPSWTTHRPAAAARPRCVVVAAGGDRPPHGVDRAPCPRILDDGRRELWAR